LIRSLFFNPLTILALIAIPAFAQTAFTDGPYAPAILRDGIVVEGVTPSDEAHRAGMRAGDVLLRWTSTAGKGEIESPFDLPYIGFEQAQRGVVRMEGLRGGRKRAWLLRTIPWGITARPNVTGPVLVAYLHAEKLARSGSLTEAVEGWRAASKMAVASGVPWLSSWFLSRAGGASYAAKQMDAADDLYREAIDHAANLSHIIRGDLFRQWGTQLEFREDFAGAEKYYREELLEWQRLGAELMVAKSLNALGSVLLTKGDSGNAESCFVQSLSISERLAPAGQQRLTSYADLAVLYQDRGDLGKAEKFYRRALAIGRKNFSGTHYYSALLTDLGTLALWRGNLEEAEQYHREALVIAAKLNSPPTMAEIFENLADFRLERGDLDGAEAYQKQSLAIRTQSGAGLRSALSLAGLGKIERLRGNIAVAEDYYRRALEIADKGEALRMERAGFLAGLGDVMLARRNLPEAEQAYRRALALLDEQTPRSLGHAETLASLAATLRGQGRLDEAAESYRQALDDLEYQAATVETIEENQARYRARHAGYYRDYMALLIEKGQPELAFQTLETARARTLFEMLAQAQVGIHQGADQAMLVREHDLRQALNAKSHDRESLFARKHTSAQVEDLDREIANLREKFQQLEADIRVNSPGYAALTQPQIPSLKDIQALLDTDTVLLEYSLGNERSYVWIVSANSLEVRELPKQAEIENLARTVYRLIDARNVFPSQETETERDARWRTADTEYAKASERLSRMILGPIASSLGKKRLLVVADGALQYIPFAALPVPAQSASGGAAAVAELADTKRLSAGDPSLPMLLDHEIVSLPSASVLVELRARETGRSKARKAVAVLADPVFDERDIRVQRTHDADRRPSEDAAASLGLLSRSMAEIGQGDAIHFRLSRLPATRKEAQVIVAGIPAGAGMEALDFRASRATALNPSLAEYRIVHFATHGLLNSLHPELSGLVLSLVDRQGRPQDGFLGLQDVYNLNLPADMVVLSGCRTGLGQEISGEGLVGLTRGFMYAGASRVVASLWSVNDEATAELMAGFYKAIERDEMRPAAALREAQIRMWKRKGWRAPYYWAAFQLQGEWR
jgi:CHAT domain-containing protein